jgi:hypothetical protein
LHVSVAISLPDNDCGSACCSFSISDRLRGWEPSWRSRCWWCLLSNVKVSAEFLSPAHRAHTNCCLVRAVLPTVPLRKLLVHFEIVVSYRVLAFRPPRAKPATQNGAPLDLGPLSRFHFIPRTSSRISDPAHPPDHVNRGDRPDVILYVFLELLPQVGKRLL